MSTASPSRVVVLAYERMLVDCERAIACLEAGLPAGKHLIHAQDLVLALRSNLDREAWDGADHLAALYTYLYQELISANVTRSVATTQTCITVIAPLLDAWRQAEDVVNACSFPSAGTHVA